MNQNIPPSQPGSSSYEPSQGGYDPGNPYLAGQQEPPPSNLDDKAPFLKSPQDRRLNVKMFLYVGAAVLLLLLLLFFLFRRATTDDKPQEQKKEQETVDVPALPETVNTPPPLPVEQAPPPIDLAADDATGPNLPPPSYGDDASSGPPQPTGPTLAERRMMSTGGGDAGGQAAMAGGDDSAIGRALDQQVAMQQQALQAAGVLPPSAAAKESLTEAVSSAQPIRNPDGLLVRGTYIRCILETRIITDIPGFTSCIVTEPVYSINGRRLLLPKGSKILGAYDTDATGPRVAVIWDRITTPNGFDINMKSPGVDGLGSAGHPGKYNAHWPSRMASALMISLVADAFKYAAAKNGPATNEIAPGGVVIQSPYESVTARTVESLANQALEKSMNRPATVTINQGTMLNVYVAQDVDFTGVLPPRAASR